MGIMASFNIVFPNHWTNCLFSNEKNHLKQVNIVTWNCNEAFRKECEYFAELHADLALSKNVKIQSDLNKKCIANGRKSMFVIIPFPSFHLWSTDPEQKAS